MAGIIRSTVGEIENVAQDFAAFLGRNGVDASTISRFESSAVAARQTAGPHGEVVSRPTVRPSLPPTTAWKKKLPTSPA
jgi:hypothetical protein